jgi:hypothetical protein
LIERIDERLVVDPLRADRLHRNDSMRRAVTNTKAT